MKISAQKIPKYYNKQTNKQTQNKTKIKKQAPK